MNSKKHKNKKSNKQSQPKHPQCNPKLENVTVSKISCIESELKDESVQEVNSELINQVESKNTEVIAPNKPKRNKSKKKKQDTVDEYEKEEEKVFVEPNETQEAIDIEATENVNQTLPEVMPVVRKNKNKKKDVDSTREEKLLQDTVCEITKAEEVMKNESSASETNPEITPPQNEIKIAKKKNKKKKTRNDSEKSDRHGEIASCTSIFQKLLDTDVEGMPMEEMKCSGTEVNVEDTSNILDFTNTTLKIKAEEDLSKAQINVTIENVETSKEDTQGSHTPHYLDTKTKKKNKKVKKEPSDITNLKKVTQIEDQSKSTAEKSEIVLEGDKTEIDNKDNSGNNFIKDSSPKPKAQIAKPVERKTKEIGLYKEISSPAPEIKETITEKNIANIDIVHILEETIQPNDKKHDQTQKYKTQDCCQHTVPVKDTSDILLVTWKEELPVISETANIVVDTKNCSVVKKQEVAKDEAIFETLVPKDFELKESDEKLNEILSTITENEPSVKVQGIKDSGKLIDNNTKTAKKNQKLPKILINPEQSTSKQTEKFNRIGNLETNAHDNKNTCSLPKPSENVEIGSLKADESEGSTCDVSPIILHPRSASEQLTDDNNNTVIQEVFEDTLDVPLLTQNVPVIQGSGETPTESPETLLVENISVEIETVSPKSTEKTDIKSKIIEVNRDMEELRLSIERSLAELSALEKSDEVSEKQVHGKDGDKTVNKEDLQKCDVAHNVISVEIDSNVSQLTTASEKTQIGDADITNRETQNIEKVLSNVTPQFESEVFKPTSQEDVLKQHDQENFENLDNVPPVCPVRRDPKKGKKKRGRQELSQVLRESSSTVQSQSLESTTQDTKTEEKSEAQNQQSNDTTSEKSNQQSVAPIDNKASQDSEPVHSNIESDYEPIENFEDALTSSADDINKSFEMIVNQITQSSQQELASNKPEINVTAPIEDTEQKDVKDNPVSPPKNLLGHPNIPARSNKSDYKKVKDKTPNTKQAKVKIKDSDKIENHKESKESQTEKTINNISKAKLKNSESFCQISNCDNFIYKYSFRKVFLQSLCHVCKKELIQFRVPCKFCSLLFYCSLKHKDEDWPQHQALCFAVSTIVHIKDQKHIYADAKNITGHNYRLLRMQTILSCEKVLKRRLVPWEQEMFLYPRICSEVSCREWRQSKLKDCEGCGQISYCSAHEEHLSKSHQRWCKSYALYQKLVIHQQTKGRLEPKLPTKVLKGHQIPEKINEVLASLYEEKIDLNDVQYAALTQIATAPLTVALSHQIYRNTNGVTKDLSKVSAFTIHVVGAELQFEADVLHKWEIFFLHLRPEVKELRVVLIGPDLNPGKLPLELLGRIRLCDDCTQNKRRVIFSFQDKKTYLEYKNEDEFIYPDIVCAFNPSFHRAAVYNGKDPWASTITAVMKLKAPFVITSHTITELRRDLIMVKDCSEARVLVEPKPNPFSSMRPDRNFISDDECPLLFKNHCFMVLCGF